MGVAHVHCLNNRAKYQFNLYSRMLWNVHNHFLVEKKKI